MTKGIFAVFIIVSLGAVALFNPRDSEKLVKYEMKARLLNTKTYKTADSNNILLFAKNNRTRDDIIVEAAIGGFYPPFLARYKAIETGDNLHKITFFVSPDYFAIGSDQEFTRVPLSIHGAVTIAKNFHALLPTRKMVDIIYEKATKKLKPRFYAPSSSMSSSATIIRHNKEIQALLGATSKDQLIAGHKKDLVISPRLLNNHDRVAIYGWHRLSAKNPIQPLSLWHGAHYVDYSHGIRLIHKSVLVDGRIRPLAKVLSDPRLAHYLSDEGPFDIEAIMDRIETGTYHSAQN